MPALGGRGRATSVRPLPGECFLNARERRRTPPNSRRVKPWREGAPPPDPSGIRVSRLQTRSMRTITRAARVTFRDLRGSGLQAPDFGIQAPDPRGSGLQAPDFGIQAPDPRGSGLQARRDAPYSVSPERAPFGARIPSTGGRTVART